MKRAVDLTSPVYTGPQNLTDAIVLALTLAGCNANEVAAYGRVTRSVARLWIGRVMRRYSQGEMA